MKEENKMKIRNILKEEQNIKFMQAKKSKNKFLLEISDL
jgi:hypothetical protein